MKAFIAGVITLAIAASSSLAFGQTAPAPATPQAAPAPVYVPPLRGAPARRIGGSSRGIEVAMPQLAVIAPDHVGLTTVEQPTLYWFISRPTKVRLEITLIDETGIKPMLELPLGSVDGPAIHALDLAKHGIRLKAGTDYQWTVALVPDAAERSGDVISGGTIRRVEPSPALREALQKAANGPASVYASQGIWYDAIDVISRQIAAQPNNAALRAQRAALAEQVGLRNVAAFDRNP